MAHDPEPHPVPDRLFVPGGFEWSFRMRAGNAEEFFAPQTGGRMLQQKKHILDANQERHVAVTDDCGPFLRAVWQMAVDWGHVDVAGASMRDLPSLAVRWEPDLLIVDSATMRMTGAAVCFPSSWDPRHATGRPVHEIHEIVPRLNPQIGASIGRFLETLAPGKAFRRENWAIARTPEWNLHPDGNHPRLDATIRIEEAFLRLEHQIFTAFPGGILMGIRIATHPLQALSADRDTWQALTEKIRTMPDDIASYKGMLAARDPLAKAMADYSP